MTAPWERLNVAWWPVIAAALSKPWPVEAVLFDLRWWEDQEEAGKAKRPGRPSLVVRWGIGDRMARNIIDKPALWSLSSVGPAGVQLGSSEGPAKVQPREGEKPAIKEKGPARVQPGSNLGPGKVQPGSSDENPDSTTSNGDALLSEIGTDRDRTRARTQIQNTTHEAREPDHVLLTALLFATRSHGMHASTEAAEPATPTTPAPAPSADPDRSVAQRSESVLLLTEPVASKPKRGKGKQSDETIAAIAAQVDRMMGRTGCALPGSGRWKQLVSAVNEAGAARVLARVTAMADAAQGLPSPAAAIFAAMAGSDYGTGPILRGHNGWTVKLDDALDASALGQKVAPEKPSGSGHTESHPTRQNGPQAPQAVSWPDVLRDLGSDPQTHPEDGPHREAWQRVRQAVLVAIRKPGDPWLAFCNADDRARQNVERLLVGGLVK